MDWYAQPNAGFFAAGAAEAHYSIRKKVVNRFKK